MAQQNDDRDSDQCNASEHADKYAGEGPFAKSQEEEPVSDVSSVVCATPKVVKCRTTAWHNGSRCSSTNGMRTTP